MAENNDTIRDRIDGIRNQFCEFQCEVGEIEVEWRDCNNSNGSIIRDITHIKYGGNKFNVSDRFLYSLSSRFGFSSSIFNIFTPTEVFERLQMVSPRVDMRVVTFGGKCLAVSNPSKSYVDYDILASMLRSRAHKIQEFQFHDGIVRTIHRMDETWDVNGDTFTQMFTLHTPIDGYGLPSIDLALQREASGAYLVASNKVFRSEIQLGDHNAKPEIPLGRAIDTFNNEEGFQSIRQRLESAQRSWASLNEVNTLYKTFNRAADQSSGWWLKVHENLVKMSGRIDQTFGIATMESISTKKARLLPVQCTIADLINFAMEVASSRRFDVISKPIYAWVGNVLSNEYDLESTKEDVSKMNGNYMEELNAIDSPFMNSSQ